jgi:hypothetical protein
MTRTTYLIAGAVLLGLTAALAGVSLLRGQVGAGGGAAGAGRAPASDSGPAVQMDTGLGPLPRSAGAGYTSLEGVRPGGDWPRLGRLKGPAQPIFYRHDVHAGQYRIPCLYCHNNAANSWTVNLPSESTCMGCHLVTSAPDTAGNPNADIAKLRDFFARGVSIPWVRINKIPEYAHFPHMRHVAAGLACQTCHGNIQQMPRVFPVRNVSSMGWCTSCHMERGVTRDCTACHF